MKKSTRIVNRLLALFLVVLMSIESFCAVVGDNDGAAFITKAEFDSLKNNFQSQIDQYNTSIDSKIDGAIAAYLAGITVNHEVVLEDMVKKAIENSAYNVSFARWRDIDRGDDVVDMYGAYHLARIGGARGANNATEGNGLWCYAIIDNAACWNGNFVDIKYTQLDSTDIPAGNSRFWWAKFPFGTNDDTSFKTTGDVQNWTLANNLRHRCVFHYRVNSCGFLADKFLKSIASVDEVPWDDPLDRKFQSDATTGNAAHQPGNWSDPDRSVGIRGIAITPAASLSHVWSDYSTDRDDFKYLNCLFAGSVSGDALAKDYNYRDYYNTENQINVRCQEELPSATIHSGARCGTLWGYRVYNEIALPPGLSGTSYDNNFEFFFKYNRQITYTLEWDHLTNNYYDTLFNEPFYCFQGLPICKTTNKTGKIKVKLKFNNKKISDNADLTPDIASYTYVIMDKKFKNGNLPTTSETDAYYKDSDGYNHVLKKETVDNGSAELTTSWIEIEKSKIMDINSGDYIYIKVEPSQNDQVVSVEVVDSITYTED